MSSYSIPVEDANTLSRKANDATRQLVEAATQIRAVARSADADKAAELEGIASRLLRIEIPSLEMA